MKRRRPTTANQGTLELSGQNRFCGLMNVRFQIHSLYFLVHISTRDLDDADDGSHGAFAMDGAIESCWAVYILTL
jgi:hypothetical protein